MQTVQLFKAFLSFAIVFANALFASDPLLKEYPEALALEIEAEKGDKKAALELGRFYDSNLSNEEKALYWFAKYCGR
jgi:hypothetical protein